MRRMLLVCLITMMLPGFLWSGNESSRRADKIPPIGIYAFVADLYIGLRIIDVSDPTNPTEVGFYDTPGDIRDVYVSWNYAYVADGSPGLRIIDVSDPTNPTEVGFYDTPGYACGVYVSGSYAYVADGSPGLRIIDVSDPSNPTEVGYCDTTDCNFNVNVSGNYAYAGTGNLGLIIIDVLVPANPFEVGFYQAPLWVEDCPLSGRYAYLGLCGFKDIKTDIKEVTISERDAHLPELDCFEIIDVSNPSNPFKVGSCYIPSYVFGVYVSGNYAYTAAYEAGLRIIDISDPTSPFVVGYYDTIGNYDYEVYVLGNYAYVADFGGYFRVIDISDPTMPSQVGLRDNIWGAYAVHVVDYESPQVIVFSPNGGETFVPSDTCDITWSVTDNVGIDSITILYSIDAGMSWDTIVNGEPNDSLYEWVIPDTQSDSCLIKILAYDPSFNVGEDQSDSLFRISSGVGIEENISMLKSFVLFQTTPNPFRDKIEITFSLGQNAEGIELKIFDVTGRLVKDFSLPTAYCLLPTVVCWDGRDNSSKQLPSGIYYCRLSQGSHTETRKILFVK